MSTFDINITGAKELQNRLNNLSGKLETRIGFELEDGARAIAAEAKQRANTGAADTGFMSNKISSYKQDILHYPVVSPAIYSAYVEFGTRSQVSVPAELSEFAAQYMGSAGASSLGAKEAIYAWCKRKGIDEKAWYAIFISIMVKGAKPHPFFFPAVNRIKPIIINKVKKVLESP